MLFSQCDNLLQSFYNYNDASLQSSTIRTVRVIGIHEMRGKRVIKNKSLKVDLLL